MKRLLQHLTVLAASAALSLMPLGCGTTKDESCKDYVAAYELYQASLATGRTPSQDEVVGAQVAAAFLTLHCGWVRTRGVDSNGVPVIQPGAKK